MPRARVGLEKYFTHVDCSIHEKSVDRLDQLWVGDITDLKVNDAWRHLVTVMNRYSRKIVGWALGDQKGTPLVSRALAQPFRRRQPTRALTFHSDRGTWGVSPEAACQGAGSPFHRAECEPTRPHE
jgi:putative transposase